MSNAYSLTVRPWSQVGGANPLPLLEIFASAVCTLRLLEMTLIQRSTAASTPALALGRPAASGVGIQPRYFVSHDPALPDSKAYVAMEWSNPPTTPANYLRRYPTPNSNSYGVPITFPAGLVIPRSGSIAVWVISQNTADFDVQLTVDA